MRVRCSAFLFVFALVAVLTPLAPAVAEELTSAPLNPAFLKYVEDAKSGTNRRSPGGSTRPDTSRRRLTCRILPVRRRQPQQRSASDDLRPENAWPRHLREVSGSLRNLLGFLARSVRLSRS
jgi:hypothetical protein